MMASFKYHHVVFVAFLSVLAIVDAFYFKDCYYYQTENRVEYICEGNTGIMFNQRTTANLYCNNFYSPAINRSDIQVINFRACKDKEMHEEFFIVFRSLRVMNISNIELEIINIADLKHCSHLEELIVDHNSLAMLPVELFKYSAELKEVNFSHNRITRLDPFQFDNTRKMTIIDFSWNLIEALDEQIFSSLRALEILKFDNNHIKSIGSDLLLHNTHLRSVQFSDNQIRSLECAFVNSLKESHSLDITINTLERFDTCDDSNSNIRPTIEILPYDLRSSLKVSEKNITWIFSKSDFLKIRSLHLPRHQIGDILSVLPGITRYFA